MLFEDNSFGIFKISGKAILRTKFDDENIERMWKNTGGRSRGIICQYSLESGKFMYLTNKFLRNAALDGICPYVCVPLIACDQNCISAYA